MENTCRCSLTKYPRVNIIVIYMPIHGLPRRWERTEFVDQSAVLIIVHGFEFQAYWTTTMFFLRYYFSTLLFVNVFSTKLSPLVQTSLALVSIGVDVLSDAISEGYYQIFIRSCRTSIVLFCVTLDEMSYYWFCVASGIITTTK